MNERINELIEEADIQFAMESIPETGLRFEGAMVSRVDLKNLAELIVRECANYAFSNEQDYYSMLKHFGMEE